MSDVSAEDRTVLKLIFWLLAAAFAILTGIGGATASHMVSQSDTMLKAISDIQSDIAAQKVFTLDLEHRMNAIEQRLYNYRTPK
jgi:TRAP-type C4-dicarboxylate transport system permease small subunit